MSNEESGYAYYLAYDDGNAVLRYKTGKLVERYDSTSGVWIEDRYMAGIYSGDVPARRLTEEEAAKRIGENALSK